MDRKILTRNEIRAGETPGITRYVLAVSLALVVVIFVALLIYFM